MDQSVLAGIGNVYRSEVLFRQRVDPFRPGKEIRRTTWDAIWLDLVDLLPLGVATGKIVTVAEQVDEIRAELAAGEVDRLTERTVLRLQAPGRAVPRLRVEDPHPGGGAAATCSGAAAANAAADRGRRSHPAESTSVRRSPRLGPGRNSVARCDVRHHGGRTGWGQQPTWRATVGPARRPLPVCSTCFGRTRHHGCPRHLRGSTPLRRRRSGGSSVRALRPRHSSCPRTAPLPADVVLAVEPVVAPTGYSLARSNERNSKPTTRHT